MNFGEVLQKSWKIIWKHKILWLFGLLASCGHNGGSGGSGGGGGNGNTSNDVFRGFTDQNLPPWIENLGRTFERMAENGTIWLIIAGIVGFTILLAIFMMVIGAFGRAGLARGAWLADTDDTTLTFKRLWHDGWHYFWRVFLTILLVEIGTAVVFMILLIPVILFGIMTLGIGLLCMIPFICLLIPLGIAIGVFEELALVSIVGEDKGIIDSLKRSWEVIRTSPGPVIVMAVILGLGGGIIRFIIGLPAILILFPILIGVIAGTQATITGGLIVAGIILLIYLPIAIFLSSVLQAYIGSAWVLTYRRLATVAGEAAVDVNISDVLPGDGQSEIES